MRRIAVLDAPSNLGLRPPTATSVPGCAKAPGALRDHGSALDGHVGLVYVDGHSDFRHPGNASYVGAAAGEDLALATGRGQGDLAAIENRRPYFRDTDVVVLGIRTHDEHRLDLHTS